MHYDLLALSFKWWMPEAAGWHRKRFSFISE